MKWIEFKTWLEQHQQLPLLFNYGSDRQVDAGYHITEIKQAPITSVDCGGVMNRWTEVVVQLWEPSASSGSTPMTADKALSIIAIVEKALPLEADALVKIEFGNAEFDTRQMVPAGIVIQNEELLVTLSPDMVQCKAIARGGSCGTAAPADDCCTPAKPKIQLISLTNNAASCTPGSGCC